MNKLLTLFALFSFCTTFSQSWTDVGGGSNNSSHGMLVWDGKLVNLGSYNNPCQRVSTWDGTNWNCLGGGVGIVARAGCVWNGNLVVVGDFWNNFQPCAGCNGVAVWDGTSWSALDQGFNNDVLTCTVHNGELYIGGDFTQANGVPVNRVVKWNELTSTFESLGNPGDMDNDVRCMTSYDGQLWVGGDFNNVAGCSPCDGLVKWDETGMVWEGGNSGVDLVGGVNETVRVLYVNPNDGNLYMGGEFPELWDGDAPAEDFDMSGIAMYDGSNWFSLGTGLNEYCRAIHEYNGYLIAGGYFTNAGGTPAQKIAKWDPIAGTWSAMGDGFDGVGIDEYVKSAAVWNGIFFAGGAYTQAEGGPMNYIAQWYEPPTNPPTAGINNSSSSVCAGGCITFLDQSTNNPTSWTWDFPGSSTPTSSDEDPGLVCWPSSGTFTVQLTACNTNGCDVITTNITIEDQPTISVSDETICEGNSANLVATPSSGGGDWLWISGGETTDNITVSPSVTTSYAVEYTLNGCTSTQEVGTVTVNPVPTITTNNGTICQGESASITATPSSSGGTYLWSPTGETASTISPSPSTTTSYSVVYTLNGCQSLPSNSTVTVNPTYALNETATICEGDMITYPDLSTETITASTSHTSALLTNSGCDSIIVTTVTMTSDYSGSEAASVCSGNDFTYPDGTISVGVIADESHVSSLMSTAGCDSVITTNLTVYSDYNLTDNIILCEGENYTYPDGTTSTNILLDESHISNLISVQGCDSIITTNISITSLPDPTITESANVLTAMQNGATYQWVDCNNGNSPIAGETSQSFAPSSNGDYAVEITLNGCTVLSGCTTISTIGFDPYEIRYSVYPNPSSGILKLESSENLAHLSFKVLDSRGRIVLVGNIDENFQINLSELENGVYFLQVENANQIRIVKH